MREILFRGKRTDNGEWAYGFYVHVPNGRFGKVSDMIQPVGKDGRLATLRDVDPETVGQYTGLTDTNGVKIFEGDIIEITKECDPPYWLNGNIFAVGFDLGTAGFYPFSEYDSDCGHYVRCSDVFIIGNIHDNPELLTEATP